MEMRSVNLFVERDSNIPSLPALATTKPNSTRLPFAELSSVIRGLPDAASLLAKASVLLPCAAWAMKNYDGIDSRIVKGLMEIAFPVRKNTPYVNWIERCY